MKTELYHTVPAFLGCDWGTSSFRLMLINTRKGTVEKSIRTSDGIQSVHDLWNRNSGRNSNEAKQNEDQKEARQERDPVQLSWESHPKQGGQKSRPDRGNQKKQPGQALQEGSSDSDRIDFYLDTLDKKIRELGEQARKNLDHLPVVVSGMASSTIGFRELPYGTIPADLKQPDIPVEMIQKSARFPRDLLLVSGLASDRDVMRGEETQILGIANKYDLETGICILPGTHSKHIFIENHSVTGFKTWMTGELFELLSTRSILRHSVSPSDDPTITDAFLGGVDRSVDEHLLHSLFEIRAKEILHHTEPRDNYDFMSGLLIGSELRTLIDSPAGAIVLAGEGALQAGYSAALTHFNIEHIRAGHPAELTAAGQQFLLGISRT